MTNNDVRISLELLSKKKSSILSNPLALKKYKSQTKKGNISYEHFSNDEGKR